MKKLLTCLTVCALLFSFGTVLASAEGSLASVLASAEGPLAVDWTEGSYACGSAEGFEPLGDVIISWVPDVAQRVDPTDGDLMDWYYAGIPSIAVTPANMISWVSRGDAMPTDWGMTMYAAADSDYLYLAFDITDGSFAYAADPEAYDGDAITLGLDFGGLLAEQIEKDPNVMTSPDCILYSFACLADGEPLQVKRESSDKDGLISNSSDGSPICLGAARRTDKGWSAELALSWQMIGDDYVWKAWDDQSGGVYIGSDQNPLTLGLTVGYLNRDETAKDVTWLGTTAKGWTDKNGTPVVNWTPYDNGATLVLPWETGMRINSTHVRNIEVFFPFETNIFPVTVETVEPPVSYDPDETVEDGTHTEREDTESESDSLDSDSAAETRDREAELNAILDKYGCATAMRTGGIVALAALVLIAALALTATVWIYRKDQ